MKNIGALKIVSSLVLLCSCAIKGNVSGDIVIHHQLDISNLEAFFRNFCSAKFTNQSDINTCIYDEINKFIALIEKRPVVK